MTTVAEKQADHKTLIDDFESNLAAFSEWDNSIDSNIHNDGNPDSLTHDWREQAALLQHGPTGIYVLAYVASGTWDPAGFEGSGGLSTSRGYKDGSGVRFVFSNDWDLDNSVPAGSTTVRKDDTTATSGDYMSAKVASDYTDSYTTSYTQNEYSGCGLWTEYDDESIESTWNQQCTYFMSLRADGFTVAAWNNNPDMKGIASWVNFEEITNKFWDDGKDNFAIQWRDNGNNDEWFGAIYGFESLRYRNESKERAELLGSDSGCLAPGEWGYKNRSTSDDTFFFRRPTVYSSYDREYPVAYMEDAVPNREEGGGNHGDIITHDTTDYRVMDEMGDLASGTHIPVALRYE
jgi:hypothetical protein